ncbi:MAG TPA: hypothetical protein VHG93_26220 [Longimicrobium sp.]|nr:hypothetical protein [Longimicrobium sp.]
MIRRPLALFTAAFAIAAPITASAQSFGPSVDFSVGVFAGAGGTFVDRGGPAMEGVLALPVARTSSGTVVAGVTGGVSGPLMMGDLICHVGPNDTCIPNFPTFVTAGAVVGMQRAVGTRLTARALAGPAYFQAVDGDDTFGLQGRLDVARRLIPHTAIVASVRGSFLPRFQGQTVSYATFGIGLRIQ